MVWQGWERRGPRGQGPQEAGAGRGPRGQGPPDA